MKIVREDEVKIPTWSLSYLVNNDFSGIEEEDKTMVDKFWNKLQKKADMFNLVVTISYPEDIDGEKYFSPYPEFGLACDVVDCKILYYVWENL